MPSSHALPPDARNIESAESYLHMIGHLPLYKVFVIDLYQTLIRFEVTFRY